MRRILLLAALAVAAASCSTEGTTTSETEGATSTSPTSTTTEPQRDCVRFTGGTQTVDTGTTETDALFLSGEIFVCSDDVVVADPGDINSFATGAQLAAALGGPVLLPHPQISAEIGRLKAKRVFLLGNIEVTAPQGAIVTSLTTTEAVDLARETLGVTEEVRLPSTPDTSTIIETIHAIRERDRVVLPQSAPEGTPPPNPAFDISEIVVGLAVPATGDIWMVDANDPIGLLMSAGTGRAVDANVVGIDPADILGFPEVGTAITTGTTISRFVGAVPDASEWELAVLRNGVQLPGGGFSILGDEVPKRYVAFYGHPDGGALGVLGEQGPQATLDRMASFVEAYEADGHQAIPTFEVMASVAAADITDGDYSFEWPLSTFTEWIDLAEQSGAYVVLDLQPGRDDFLTQAKEYEELLLNPHVGLALDPEWRLKPDELHLQQVGRVEASEVNLVVDWLADLVRDNGLPQKLIIVHQFREFMIQDRSSLKQRPELQMIVQMDGQGPIGTKDTTWSVLTKGWESHHWSWGWKNFFDEDSPTPSPEHTMGKVPIPVFVSYQ